MHTLNSSKSRQAFTLIELIIVVTIIGIMMAFTVPAISSALKANKITQAADLLRAKLAFAQQTALKENAPIQVRIFQYADPSRPGDKERFRAYQLFRRKSSDLNDRFAGGSSQNVESMEPVTPLQKSADSDWCAILSSSPIVTGSRPCVVFRKRAAKSLTSGTTQ